MKASDRTREPEQFELAYLGRPGKVAPETVQLDLLPAEHADVPVTPLLLADAAGFSELQQGRGARLDKRYYMAPVSRCETTPQKSTTVEQRYRFLFHRQPGTGICTGCLRKKDGAT